MTANALREIIKDLGAVDISQLQKSQMAHPKSETHLTGMAIMATGVAAEGVTEVTNRTCKPEPHMGIP